ncbi:hypothetical protein SK128_027448 [Halocaridina rubra]|uniref:Ankyrin repeat protein n=1 Tax=Halocaridina rubra TaxID=373956 RepID=A0AAN8ZXD8_HALRR
MHLFFFLFILGSLTASVLSITKGKGDKDECATKATTEQAFLTACFRGNNERLQELLALSCANSLLAAKEGVSAGFRFGYTGLIWAAEKNHTKTLRLLLEYRGAGSTLASYSTNNGISALYHAARLGNLDSVNLILSKDPSNVINMPVTYGEHNGTTPLLAAARNGHTNIVKILLNSGADPHVRLPETGYFPMYFAAKLGDQEMVKELIRVDSPVNLQTSSGVSALAVATAWGHQQTVDALLIDQADPNLVDVFKTSPLHRAAYYGYTNILKLLIGKGADVNAQNLDGRTAMHFAAIGGHTATLRALLPSCPALKTDKNSRTALEAAQLEELNLSKRKTTSETSEKLRKLKEVLNILKGYSPCN